MLVFWVPGPEQSINPAHLEQEVQEASRIHVMTPPMAQTIFTLLSKQDIFIMPEDTGCTPMATIVLQAEGVLDVDSQLHHTV